MQEQPGPRGGVEHRALDQEGYQETNSPGDLKGKVPKYRETEDRTETYNPGGSSEINHKETQDSSPGHKIGTVNKGQVRSLTQIQTDESTELSSENPSWEAQMEWMYAGHGEWVQPTTMGEVAEHGNKLKAEPGWVQNWLAKQDEDIRLHNQVLELGYPNRWGAKIPVNTKWNLQLLQELLEGYEDQEVTEWLKYGWPIGRLPTLPPPQLSYKNQKGAQEHPEALEKYIQKEQSHGAIMGPYKNIPFHSKVGISPPAQGPRKPHRTGGSYWTSVSQ